MRRWLGWVTQERLFQAEEFFDTHSRYGFEGAILELAMANPEKYSSKRHAVDEDGNAACGVSAPAWPPGDASVDVVAFFTTDEDGVAKCKRCLKKEQSAA